MTSLMTPVEPDRFGTQLPWDDRRESTLVCTARRDVAPGLVNFTFVAPQSRRFDFLPGQFLTVRATIDGAEVERCYSISSPPTRPYAVSITVKNTGGQMSSWLHRSLQPGEHLTASGPLGSFTCVPRSGGRYLFLSAGSGITPIMSMIRTAYDLGVDANIVFAHSARTSADVPFYTELADLSGFRKEVTITGTLTGSSDSVPSDLTPHRGRLDANLLATICPDVAERDIYVCGPESFMIAARDTASTLGAATHRYHEESFTLAEPEVPVIDSASTGFAVTLTKRARTIVCPPEVPILLAAAAQGVTLPSSCGAGLCGTCKVTKLSGTVTMEHQGGIRPREIAAGKILTCSAIPTSDVVLDA